MLWFVCFFNYADRQAIYSVFPLLKSQMHLDNSQLAIVGSSFMWVYALSGPFAGMIGDRLQRRTLIIGGLIFWSLVTVATAFSTTYWQLVLFRALEGLGEAFYFPASMSLVSDYHGRDTRSRAMAIHQSSVYAGTIAGGAVAGHLGQYYGWRSSFYLFGGLGTLLGIVLLTLLKEPARGQSEQSGDDAGHGSLRLDKDLFATIRRTFEHRMVPILISVFVGANFVAMIFLTWMPTFLLEKFHMSLSMAGLSGTAYIQIASVCGVMTGGFLADRFARRSCAGRMWTQSLGLLLGIPFIFLAGWTLSVPLLVLGMTGFGFSKGLYDANIWASLYDVVTPENRATALGLMNSIGWLGGSVAPLAVARAAESYGMGVAISASSVVYLIVGLLLIFGIKAFMKPAVPAPAAA